MTELDSTSPHDSATIRQREILLAAIELFHDRGYHATGMNDIGEAVGLTGPALYRHFAGKEDILETALLNAASYMEAKVARVVDAGAEPRASLQALVRDLVQVVVEYPAIVAIALTERRFMNAKSLAIYDRSTRLRMAEWVGPLLEMRPDLDEPEARLRVRAAQNMIAASTVGHLGLTSQRRTEFLTTAAMAVLLDDGGRTMPQPLEDPAEVDDVA